MTNEDKKAIAEAIGEAIKEAVTNLSNAAEVVNFASAASDIGHRAQRAAEQRLRRHTSSGRY